MRILSSYRLRFILVLLVMLGGVSVGLVSAQFEGNDRLVVWTAPAAAPGQHTGAEPGQIALLDAEGMLTPLLDLPQGTSRVTGCGTSPQSPDGRQFAFYVGQDEGGLYIMTGTDAPLVIDEVPFLTCTGTGALTFAPDGGRFAYIDYLEIPDSSRPASGFLKIYETSGVTEVTSFENTTAFAIDNQGVALVNFFTNSQGEADEAAVIWWDGSSQREVATLIADEGCRFTSASIDIAPNNNFALVMGRTCAVDGEDRWQLYTVDRDNRTAALAASGVQSGDFFPFTSNNNVFFAPNNEVVFFTAPDGFQAHTVGIIGVTLADAAETLVIDRQAVFSRDSLPLEGMPTRSDDGRWLAGIITSPDNDNSVYAFDLNTPDIAPIIISAGSRGDTISDLAFRPDNARLVFTAGATNGGNNSLLMLDLAAGVEQRVSRGRYGTGFAMSPDGAQVALLDWQVLEDEPDPVFTNTVIVDLDSAAVTTVYEGAELVDGEVESVQFAAPLAWMRQ